MKIDSLVNRTISGERAQGLKKTTNKTKYYKEVRAVFFKKKYSVIVAIY